MSYNRKMAKRAPVVKIIEKDKLDLIFKCQKDLQELLGHSIDDMIIEEKEAYTRDNFLGIMAELNDLMGEINWNKWKPNKKVANQNKIVNIMNDAFHYFINICLVWDIYPEELYDKYNKRNKSLLKKIKNNKLKYIKK